MTHTLLSWNVNGLRACKSKGAFDALLEEVSPDVLCLQETKLQEGQLDLALSSYKTYWNYADKKGYSGTAILVKDTMEVTDVAYGMGIDVHDHEGRIITLSFPSYHLVTVYTPNAKQDLARLDYRMTWEDDFRAYLKSLEQKKPVIVCGDLNVAHKEIDLKNPSSNHHNAGFTDEERGRFQALLDAGFVDTFRHFYPGKEGVYSWWSYRFHARENNAGWRIDYFLCSRALLPQIKDAMILTQVTGSDHCPVGLVVDA